MAHCALLRHYGLTCVLLRWVLTWPFKSSHLWNTSAMDQIHHYTPLHKISLKTNHTTKISVDMLLNMLQHNLIFFVERICVCFHFRPNKECVLNSFTSQCIAADCQWKETLGDYFYTISFLHRFWQSTPFCSTVTT